MKYVWTYVVMSWLLVKFYVLSFTPAQIKHTSIVDPYGDPAVLYCPDGALIKILNVSVKNDKYCESEPCNIDDGDHEVLRRLCDNSAHCLISGSDLLSACVLQYRRFNLSYFCEAPSSLHCNFENDDACTLEQDKDDDFDWTKGYNKTLSTGTGPDSDHTTGWGFYLYIEANRRGRNQKAKLISETIVCKYAQCLTFWYHMYGNHIGSLSVYQKPGRNVWKRSGINNNQWKQAKVDLNCDEPFQIVIEGKIKDSKDRWLGDIALDDVFVFGGSCQTTGNKNCDFEQQQSCTLQNTFDMSDDQYIFWNVVQGKETTNGPATDHTIKSEDGYFFHLDAFESPGKGRLESDPRKLEGPNCFTIWYYIIGSTNTFTFYMLSGDEIRNIMTIHGHSEEKWKKMTVSVDIVGSVKIIFEGSLKEQGSISLDDMSIYEGVCIEEEEHFDSCLSINKQYEIEECATVYFQRDSLDIAMYPSFTNSNNEKECTDQKIEIEKNLNQFCVNNYLYSTCKFNLKSQILDYNECFTFKKRLLITYICTEEKTATTVSSDSTAGDSSAVMESTKSYSAVSDESVTLPRAMRNSNESATVITIGLVIGVLLLVCVVILIIVLIRRHTFKSNQSEKIRNNLGENNYIGNQDIALPLTSSHSKHIQNTGIYNESSDTNVHDHDSKNAHAHNINEQPEYTNVGAVNGLVNNEVQVPAYAHRQDKTFATNHMPDDDEYAIVDPTAETSFNENMDIRTETSDSYMVLDPTQTGFNRQIPSNTPLGYVLAKPLYDTENKFIEDDQYAISDGVYDHSGHNRHKESENNIYNHTVDTIYDSGSHKRNEEGREDTYDHFFGQTTEDDYDITTTS